MEEQAAGQRLQGAAEQKPRKERELGPERLRKAHDRDIQMLLCAVRKD